MFKISNLLSDEQVRTIFGKHNKIVNVTLLTKNENLGLISWKGETENLYFLIHYIFGLLYLSFDERELKCSYKENILYVGKLKDIIEITDINNIDPQVFIKNKISTQIIFDNHDQLFKNIVKFFKWSKVKNLEILQFI